MWVMLGQSIFTPLTQMQTKYMTAADINIGIGALLETFEMMCVSL